MEQERDAMGQGEHHPVGELGGAEGALGEELVAGHHLGPAVLGHQADRAVVERMQPHRPPAEVSVVQRHAERVRRRRKRRFLARQLRRSPGTQLAQQHALLHAFEPRMAQDGQRRELHRSVTARRERPHVPAKPGGRLIVTRSRHGGTSRYCNQRPTAPGRSG